MNIHTPLERESVDADFSARIGTCVQCANSNECQEEVPDIATLRRRTASILPRLQRHRFLRSHETRQQIREDKVPGFLKRYFRWDDAGRTGDRSQAPLVAHDIQLRVSAITGGEPASDRPRALRSGDIRAR
jgi:hypothetical protein